MEHVSEPLVLRNFLDESYFNTLKEELYSCKPNWCYVDHSIPVPTDTRKLLFTDAGIFRYLLVYGGELNVCEEHFKLIKPFLSKLSDYFKHRKIIIRRIAANLLPRNKKLLGKYNYPHIDQDYSQLEQDKYDLYTGIFYFEDGNGDTLLIDNSDHISIIGRMTPVENTLVLFDAYQWHSAPCSSEEKKRIVINFNLMVEKNTDENITIYDN
jgi:hypothetical protein